MDTSERVLHKYNDLHDTFLMICWEKAGEERSEYLDLSGRQLEAVHIVAS